MSTEREESARLFEPAEILYIAGAVAEREFREQEIMAEIFMDFSGEELPRVPNELREKSIATRAAFLARAIEDPTYVPTLDEVVDSWMADSYEVVAEQIGEGYGAEASPEQARELIIGANRRINDDLGRDNQVDVAFTKTFVAAQTIAQAHGVGVAEVYQDEAFYCEALRTAQSLEEFVSAQFMAFSVLKEQALNATLVQAEELFMSEVDRAIMSEDEKVEFFMELQLNPDFQEGVAQGAELVQTVAKRFTVAHIVRVWGQSALYTLSVEVQQDLCVYESGVGVRAAVFEIGGMALAGDFNEQETDRLFLREAFIGAYCEKQGWDVEDLSIEQVMQIRQQPGWQNPAA